MMLVSMTFWSLVCAVAFEYARVFRAYDYRSFCRHLLGRGWVVFELTYAAMLMVVLAVIASAAGSILEETFGLPYAVGVVGIMVAIGFLVFEGTGLIEKVLASWSFVLYGTFTVLFAWSLSAFSSEIGTALSTVPGGRQMVRGWHRLCGVQRGHYPRAALRSAACDHSKRGVGRRWPSGPHRHYPGSLPSPRPWPATTPPSRTRRYR